MVNHEKLYEAFGELLYVIAMEDGSIQEEELEVVQQVLQQHPWASDIQWSFRYEQKKQRNVAEVYDRVLDFCKHAGPHPEYANMIEVMQQIAAAHDGVNNAEAAKMKDFQEQLIKRFQQDIAQL